VLLGEQLYARIRKGQHDPECSQFVEATGLGGRSHHKSYHVPEVRPTTCGNSFLYGAAADDQDLDYTSINAEAKDFPDKMRSGLDNRESH
jgi:hypothetical protein